MDWSSHGASGDPVEGRQEMQELALSAIDAFEAAGLTAEVRAIYDRLLLRRWDELFEITSQPEEGWRWSFKPMVELLLVELRAVAADADIPLDERRRRLEWAFWMSGY